MNIFLLYPLVLFGQSTTISLLFAPADMGGGLRYDKQINDIGIYGAACMENKVHNKETDPITNISGIKNHLKLSAGLVKYVPDRKRSVINFFSLGLCYHSYGMFRKELYAASDKIIFPLSPEFGVGIIISHFSIGWCYDPVKKDVVVNSGFYFN